MQEEEEKAEGKGGVESPQLQGGGQTLLQLLLLWWPAGGAADKGMTRTPVFFET